MEVDNLTNVVNDSTNVVNDIIQKILLGHPVNELMKELSSDPEYYMITCEEVYGKLFRLAIDKYLYAIRGINYFNEIQLDPIWVSTFTKIGWNKLALEMGDQDVYFEIASSYEALDMKKKSEEYYHLGIQHGDQKCIIYLLELYFNQRKYDEILNWCSKLNPNENVYYHVARAYEMKKDYNNALKYYILTSQLYDNYKRVDARIIALYSYVKKNDSLEEKFAWFSNIQQQLPKSKVIKNRIEILQRKIQNKQNEHNEQNKQNEQNELVLKELEIVRLNELIEKMRNSEFNDDTKKRKLL